jgi:hypothetical protein
MQQGMSIGKLAQLGASAIRLRGSTGRLDAMSCADDRATDLWAVLSWPYQALGGLAMRLFSLHTGSDIPATAAAGLAGLPPACTRPLLAERVAGHLIGEYIAGRYILHRLLRACASHLALIEESAGRCKAAESRSTGRHLDTACAAGPRDSNLDDSPRATSPGGQRSKRGQSHTAASFDHTQ